MGLEHPPASAPDDLDRRPIATRDAKFSQLLTRWLVDLGVSPNAISGFGMLAGIAGGLCLAATGWTDGWAMRGLWLLGAICIQLRLLCNMLDGMVAVATGTTSPVGHLYNEVPDRVSDSFTLIGLGSAFQSSPLLGLLAALLAMFTAYVRSIVKVAGGPQLFHGPMAKPQRMFFCTVLALFMAVAPASWRAEWRFEWSDARLGIPAALLLLICVGSFLTALRRLWLGAQALRRAADHSAD